MPSQQLLDEISTIIDHNRAKAGLSPLTQCKGDCGRRVEGDLCVTCAHDAEKERIRVFLENRNTEARARLAARAVA